MIYLRNALLLCWISVCALPLAAQITPSEARDHVGEITTICGSVRTTRYAFTWKGAPTFIALDAVEDDFAIIIWKKDLSKFHQPTFDYLEKYLCVIGKIKNKGGHLRVEARNPSQITVQQTRLSKTVR